MKKFRGVLSRWERKELSGLEASELLGISERQFRRYRDRYEEEGLAGLADKRLGKASARRVPVDEIAWMLDQYRSQYWGWNVKHCTSTCKSTMGSAGATRGLRRSCMWRGWLSGEAARSPPSQAAQEALRGHDAASGWQPGGMAGRLPAP